MTSSASGPMTDDEARTALLNGMIGTALGLQPNDLRLGLDIAKSQLERGRPAEALKSYAMLVLCEPTNVDFQVGLANCALRIEEYHLALQAASAVVALRPRDPRGYLLSGRACIGLSAPAEAREDLTDAVTFAKAAGDDALAAEAERLLKQASLLTS